MQSSSTSGTLPSNNNLTPFSTAESLRRNEWNLAEDHRQLHGTLPEDYRAAYHALGVISNMLTEKDRTVEILRNRVEELEVRGMGKALEEMVQMVDWACRAQGRIVGNEEEMRVELAMAKRRVEEKEAELVELKGKLERLEGIERKLEEECWKSRELAKEKEELKNTVEHLRALNGELNQDLHLSKNNLNVAEQKLQEKKAELIEKTVQAQGIKRQFDEECGRNKELTKEKEELKNTAEHLRARNLELETEHRITARNLNVTEQTLQDKEAELAEKTTQAQHIKKQFDEECWKNKELNKELERLKAQNLELNVAEQKLKDKDTELEANLQEEQRRTRVLSLEVESLKKVEKLHEESSSTLKALTKLEKESSERKIKDLEETIKKDREQFEQQQANRSATTVQQQSAMRGLRERAERLEQLELNAVSQEDRERLRRFDAEQEDLENRRRAYKRMCIRSAANFGSQHHRQSVSSTSSETSSRQRSFEASEQQ